MGSVRSYRKRLVHSLEEAAQWRAQVSQKYPNDERTERSAKALVAAACEVDALPDDDPRLLLLVRLQEAGDEAVCDFLEEEHCIISRHGVCDHTTRTTDELLWALVRAADNAVLSSLDDCEPRPMMVQDATTRVDSGRGPVTMVENTGDEQQY